MRNAAGDTMRVGRELGINLVGVIRAKLFFIKDSYRDNVTEIDLWSGLKRHNLPGFG